MEQRVLKEEKNYDGLMMGIVFTFGSLLLTLTFFIPIVTIIPGTLVEAVAKKLVDNTPYSNVGEMTIILLTVILVVAVLIVLVKIRLNVSKGGRISKIKIALAMAILFFIVHSLGFYIYWGVALGFRGDGQLIFSAVDSFPKSSWAFIPVGVIIDITKNFKRKATAHEHRENGEPLM